MASADPMPDGAAGFTLVEVLVALAIAATVLGAAFSVMGDGLRRAGQAEKERAATLQAQSMLAAVGKEIAIREGSAEGHFADGSRWQRTIERYGDAADHRAWPVAAYTVTIFVRWQDGSSERKVELATLRLGQRTSAP